MISISADSSAKSLKEQNEPKLYAFTAFQFALFGLFFALENIPELPASDLTTGIFGAVALGGIAVAATVLTDILPTSVKNRLAHGFFPQSKVRLKTLVKRYLHGADERHVLAIFEMDELSGVADKRVFDKIREILEYSPVTQQAYKKYLLLREYAIIQLLISIPLLSVVYLVYKEPSPLYGVYMTSLFLALVCAVNSTDRRHVELVIKRASFVHANIKDAIKSGEVQPLKATK